jgi:hypothetical protein
VAKHPSDQRTRAANHLPEAINNQHDGGDKVSASEEGRHPLAKRGSKASARRQPVQPGRGGRNKAKAGIEAETLQGEQTTTTRTRRKRVGARQRFRRQPAELPRMTPQRRETPQAPLSSDQHGQSFRPESTPERREVEKRRLQEGKQRPKTSLSLTP